jgi:hypothetical protein
MIVAAMIGVSPGSVWARLRHELLAAATVIGWILLAGVIASSYVGHSFSPYGTCHNAQGRGIPCIAGRR